jgi:peptide/nickel transport system ATP-binding protein
MAIKERKELLKVTGLCKEFSLENRLFGFLSKEKKQRVKALNSVSFSLFSGETIGLLGESGSGKSTLARVLMGVYAPDCGKAFLNGTDIFSALKNTNERLKIYRQIQMIFQDPYGSLDPRMTVRQIISEPLKIHGLYSGTECEKKLIKALDEVGLSADSLDRYPAEFSGGQRQRIGICRAMILDPAIIIADEAVSALDVSVQAQILELLCRLRSERKLAMIFISHDVAVVRQIADRILLLFRGNLVEEMPADCLLKDAAHPYTLDLLESASYLREGKLPKTADRTDEKTACFESADNLQGCCYRNVCSQAYDKCKETPEEVELHDGHRVFCWKAKKQKG